MPAVITSRSEEPAAATAALRDAAPGGHRLYWIDWLRFLAAFAVMAEHARAANWKERFPWHDSAHPFLRGLFYSATTFGRPAVVIFFILSGWLVGGNVIRKVRAGTFDAASYAADRFARVYVPLVPALLLTAAAVRAFDAPLHPVHYLACLVGVQDIYSIAPGQNAPLWTLAYEIWFYVLTGCAAVLCRRGSTPTQRVVAGAGAALAVTHCLMLQWTYAACWILGVAGPWVRSRIAPRARGWLAAASGLVLVTATVFYQSAMDILPAFSVVMENWMPTAEASQLVIGLSALVLVASVADLAPGTRVGQRIERTGVSLAAFSYTLYLTHYPIIWSLGLCLEPMPRMLDGPSTLRFLLWLSIGLAVALGMYALFESRTPQVRRWLRARIGGGPVRAEVVPGPVPVIAGA